MINYTTLKEELSKIANPKDIDILQKFFKTNKGDYAEGDIFIGVKVPQLRNLAKKYYIHANLDLLKLLISSSIHEERALALHILVLQFQKTKSIEVKKQIFEFYINHRQFINNWDLVDVSTYKIVSPYLELTNNLNYLFQLASDEHFWTKRIAVVSLWYLWRKGYYNFGLELLKINLKHPHDLMHKANGWMLRELSLQAGNTLMLTFIEENYSILPRTTLRYAIEKLPQEMRKKILKGDFKFN